MTTPTTDKTIRITLDVTVRPMTAAEAHEACYGDDYEPENVSPYLLAEAIEGVLQYEDTQSEMFAGSGIFVVIESVTAVAS